MKAEAKAFHVNTRPSLVAQAARERQTVVINDVAQSENYFRNPRLPRTQAEAVFPMVFGDDLIGALDLQSESANRFQESDAQIFATLAEQIAIAVRNAQLYRQQENLAKELERADHMKTQFLSSMSHELRTPLNAIINFNQLIAMGAAGPVTEDQSKMLGTAISSSKHLLQLINDVLVMTKIQAGKLVLYVEDDTNLNDEIKMVVDIAAPLLEKQNASLEQPIQFLQDIDDLPLVSCDRRRIRQTLLNLLSNAIKFTEQGSITLSVKHKGDEILFAMMDTGPGISAAAQAQIFEPFVQTLDGVKAQGTGLGLPISRSLIQAHGGDLWVESKVGEGSTFFFTLPISLDNPIKE